MQEKEAEEPESVIPCGEGFIFDVDVRFLVSLSRPYFKAIKIRIESNGEQAHLGKVCHPPSALGTIVVFPFKD